MSSSFPGQWPPRRKSTTPAPSTEQDDAGLTDSLSQLSLTNDPTDLRDSRRSNIAINTPLKRTPQRDSSTRHNFSRSPSSHLPPSRPGSSVETPPLIRQASMNSLQSANGSGFPKFSSRRASSGQALTPTPGAPSESEKPLLTASSIANNYFRTELEMHHSLTAAMSTSMIVILNDAVYGHRFSRPRTSRNALSTIVERPERIKACVLGISAAYVRLGGRHCQGNLPIHPKVNVRDIDSIPFRIHKTTRRLPLLSAAVTNVHGTKWMEELKLMCNSAESILAMGGKELQRPDVPKGVDQSASQKLHEGDLYLCAESLEAMEGALGAVCEAVDIVFGQGPRKAFVGVRPPGHHCSASFPSGFCWVNNVHVGIMHGILTHGLTHAAIIDFDLHHGDGSQSIAWNHNSRAMNASKTHASWKKTSIGYFSLHDINSYPCEMSDEEKVKNASLCIDNAHGQTIWNAHLRSWKTEAEFWNLYETTYRVIIEKSRNYLKNQAQRLREADQTPKAAIFFSAGFDASEWECAGMQRHQVNVPTDFYARLTQDFVNLAGEEGLGVDGRVISVLEGGYSDRALASGIMSHLSGFATNGSTVDFQQKSEGLGEEVDLNIAGSLVKRESDLTRSCSYDSSWWASDQLDQLDQLEQAVEQPSSQRRPRDVTPPTFSSPTQASTARVADPVRMRQSLSTVTLGYAKFAETPVSPPPPEVSWVVAAKELCRVLVPSNRQTDSCKPEELNAEASRARRDRQSVLLGLPPPPTPSKSERPSSRMSLRERKSRAIESIEETNEDTMSRTRRKQTYTPVASPVKHQRGTPQPSGAQSARLPLHRIASTSAQMSPPREETSSELSLPATAPVPRRSTTSRPNSRTGRNQTSNDVSRQRNGTESARKPLPSNGSRTVARKKMSTPTKTGQQQPSLGVDTPTPSTGLMSEAVDNMKGDLDKLASGMKKIRINLITQPQKDAKLKIKERSDPSPGLAVDHNSAIVTSEDLSKPAGVSAVPKAPADQTTQFSQVSILQQAPPAPSSRGGPEPLANLEPPRATSSSTSGLSIPEDGSVVVSQDTTQAVGQAADLFIPYQPEGPEPVAVMQTESLKWLPPNVSTPAPSTPSTTPSPGKQRQSGLFVYQSGIPFAPRPEKGTQKPSVPAAQQPTGGEKKPG